MCIRDSYGNLSQTAERLGVCDKLLDYIPGEALQAADIRDLPQKDINRAVLVAQPYQLGNNRGIIVQKGG